MKDMLFFLFLLFPISFNLWESQQFYTKGFFAYLGLIITKSLHYCNPQKVYSAIKGRQACKNCSFLLLQPRNNRFL